MYRDLFYSNRLTSCIQSMYILIARYFFFVQTKKYVFLNIKMYIFAAYKEEIKHLKAVVSQYHAISEVVTLYLHIASLC